MNRYKLSKAGISATEGIARFNGDIAMYESMLKAFPRDPNYAELVRAIEKQDVAAAFVAAHSLKGAAGNLSMNRLFQDILPLVDQLRSGSLENAAQLLLPVTAAYEAVMAALS